MENLNLCCKEFKLFLLPRKHFFIMSLSIKSHSPSKHLSNPISFIGPSKWFFFSPFPPHCPTLW